MGSLVILRWPEALGALRIDRVNRTRSEPVAAELELPRMPFCAELSKMSAVRTAMLVVAVASLGAGNAHAQLPGRGQSALLSEQSLNRLGLTRAWWGHAVTDRQRDRLVHLTADEKLAIAQSSSGIVSAFDPETGRLLWYKQVGLNDAPSYAAAYNDDYVFIISSNRLFALQRETGHEAFVLALPGQPFSPPVADAEQIYVGCNDGSMYAFDLQKVKKLHSEGRLRTFSDVAIQWRYRSSKAIASPAVLNGSQVVFSSLNGSVYSVAALDRKLTFQFETDAPLSAPIVRYNDLLILASEDFNVYALNLKNGGLAWQFTTGLVIKRAPVLIDDELYIIPEYGSMYKVEAATGVRVWNRAFVKDFLAASVDRLYTIDRNDNLLVLSRETGDPLGLLPLGAFRLRFPNSDSDRIFLATETGLICCLHERGREFPKYHRRPDREPLSPEIAPDDAPPEAGLGTDDAGDETGSPDAAGEMPAEEEMPEEPVEDAPEDSTEQG